MSSEEIVNYTSYCFSDLSSSLLLSSWPYDLPVNDPLPTNPVLRLEDMWKITKGSSQFITVLHGGGGGEIKCSANILWLIIVLGGGVALAGLGRGSANNLNM